MLQGWSMKLAESTNICCTSVRVTCTINVNIKEIYMGNDGFLDLVNGLQSENKRPIN